MNDPRDDFIGKVVRGKTFADIGGLWRTTNEKVSVAHQHGATDLTMIDIQPPSHPLWTAFEERRRALGVPRVRHLSGDILQLAAAGATGSFDVVHCSGVLYHLPNPMEFLLAMHRVTRAHLILSSSVTADVVRSDAGTLEIPKAAALFVPALVGAEGDIVRAYWRSHVGEGAIGLTRQLAAWTPDDYNPWWWLPTVDCLKAMCIASGFTCVDGAPSWNGNAYTLWLRVR